MKKQIIIYRSAKFDGNIHIKLQGYYKETFKIEDISYELYRVKNGISTKIHVEKSTVHAITIKMKDNDIDQNAKYYVKAIISNDKNDVLISNEISIGDIFLPSEPLHKIATEKDTINKYFTTKENFRLYENAEDYYIEVLFKEGGSKKFLSEQNPPLYFQAKNNVSNNITFRSTYSLEDIGQYKNNLGEFIELHRITGNMDIDTMISIAQEIGQLDYVKYSVVTPAKINHIELKLREEDKNRSEKQNKHSDLENKRRENTPDFIF